MWKGPETRAIATVLVGLLGATQALAGDKPVPPPLPVEPIGIVETLPREYPESWFLVHDAAFYHMSEGKVWVLDTAEDTIASQVQGTFNVSMIGSIQQSASRAEIYATETFQTRGTRGERTDVLTIWDQENLSPVAEVVLPQGKRFMGLPERDALMLLNDDRWLAIANFSPAASVTLVDLEEREIIGNIGTPGCVLTYPAGKLGFSSLCADGRFLSTELAEDGSLVQQVRTEPFFDSDDSPIFERPAYVGDMAYFPTFAGKVFPVDVSGKVAQVEAAWHLVPEPERAQGWAPGGIGITAEDDLGRFYVLMHPEATDGSHNGGGAEVWVYDPAEQARVARIALREWGLSLAVSRGSEPKLLVTNPVDMSLELYDVQSGEFIRTITDLGQNTPLMMYGAR